MKELKNALKSEKELHLSEHELAQLRGYIADLEKEAEYAGAYRTELCDRLKSRMKQRDITLEYEVSESIMKKLSVVELQALIEAFGAKESRAAAPQLYRAADETPIGNTEFRI